MPTSFPRPPRFHWMPAVAFVGLYLLLDWVSFIDPLHGLNITPWNPDPALGLVYWLRYGRPTAAVWFIALVAGDVLVRGTPGGWLDTIALSACLTLGYGLIGEVLQRRFRDGAIFDSRYRLFHWLTIVTAGTILNATIYVSLLSLTRLIPADEWWMALIRFSIGDVVGVVVSMPFIWMVASEPGRARLRTIVPGREAAGYIALAILVLWIVFGLLPTPEFKHFYLLFLPIIWAAARQGLPGTALIAFILQLGIIAIVKWGPFADLAVFELQMLGAVLALVGFFIGTVVDEQRQAAEELKQTLRLAAAGEMAAALAHELNQPLTALSAYGKACQHLLERGETGPVLQEAIGRMIAESGRAADVVRRLRDFFRTGAMRLEAVNVGELVESVSRQFEKRLAEHGIRVIVSPLPAVSIHADRLQLELVLRNLLNNACDATLTRPAGERRIELTAESLGGGRLRVSVQDSGPGVSSAVAARLFEPFVSTKSSGLGLGLVLSRAIVEAHGGTLWAEVADHGIFRFILPLAESGEDHVA